jgi:hypothetical protein
MTKVECEIIDLWVAARGEEENLKAISVHFEGWGDVDRKWGGRCGDFVKPSSLSLRVNPQVQRATLNLLTGIDVTDNNQRNVNLFLSHVC